MEVTSVSLAQVLKSSISRPLTPHQPPWQFQPLMFQSQLLSHWSTNQSISEAGYCGNPAQPLSLFLLSPLWGQLAICLFAFSEEVHHTAHRQVLCKSEERRKYLSHECTCKDFSQHSTTLPLASPLLFTSYLPRPFPSDPLRTACLCPSPPGLLTTMVLTNRDKSKWLPWPFLHPF